jgi:hypothetical protein
MNLSVALFVPEGTEPHHPSSLRGCGFPGGRGRRRRAVRVRGPIRCGGGPADGPVLPGSAR